jgi:hypothetical protein
MILLKTDSSAYFHRLAEKLDAFLPTAFPPDVRVRLGGTVATAAALNDVTVRGKFVNILQIARASWSRAGLCTRPGRVYRVPHDPSHRSFPLQ